MSVVTGGTDTAEDSFGASGAFPCAFLIQQCLRSVSTEHESRLTVTSRRTSTALKALRALAGLYSQKLPDTAIRDDIRDSLRVQLRNARVGLQEQLFRHRYLYSFLQEVRDSRPEPASTWQAFRHYNYYIFRNFLTPDPSVNSEKLPPLFLRKLEEVINALTIEDKTQFYVRIVALLREYVDIAVANFVSYVPALEETSASSYLACLLSYYSAFVSATLKLSEILAEFIQFINERFHVNWYLFNQRIFYQYFYQRPEVQEKLPSFLEMYDDQQQPGLINLLRSYTLFVENMNRLDTHWEIQRKRIDILNERNMRTESEWLERDWKMFEEMRRITKTNYWFARTKKEMAIQDMEELDSQLLELLSSTWLTGERIITLAGTCVCEDCLLVEFFQTLLPPNHRLRNNSCSTGIRHGNSALYEVPVWVKEVWTKKYERPLNRLMMCSLCQESVLLNAYSNHIVTSHSSPEVGGEETDELEERKDKLLTTDTEDRKVPDQVNDSTNASGKSGLENRISLLLLEKSNFAALPVNSPHIKRYSIGNNANRLLQFELPPSLASSVRALHGMSKTARYIEYSLNDEANAPIHRTKRPQSHRKSFNIKPKLHNHLKSENCGFCLREKSKDSFYAGNQAHCLECCDVKDPSTITIFPRNSDNISISESILNSSTNLRPYSTLTSSSSSSSSCCSNSDVDDFCIHRDSCTDSTDSEVIVVLKNQKVAIDVPRNNCPPVQIRRIATKPNITGQRTDIKINGNISNETLATEVVEAADANGLKPILINSVCTLRPQLASRVTNEEEPFISPFALMAGSTSPVILEGESSSSDGGPEFIILTSDDEDIKPPITPIRGPKRHLPEIQPPDSIDDIFKPDFGKVFLDVELEPNPPSPFGAPEEEPEQIPESYTTDVLSTADEDVSGIVLIPAHSEELKYQYSPQTQLIRSPQELNLCEPSTRLDANCPAPGFWLSNQMAQQLKSYERGSDPPELFVDADENTYPAPPQYPNQDSIQHSDGLDDCSRLFQAFVSDAARTYEMIERDLNLRVAQLKNAFPPIEDYILFEDASAPTPPATRIETPNMDHNMDNEEIPEPQLDDFEFDIPDFVPGDDFPEDLQDCLDVIERLKQKYMIDEIPQSQAFPCPSLTLEISFEEKSSDDSEMPTTSSAGMDDACSSGSLKENAEEGNSEDVADICSTGPCGNYPECECFLNSNMSSPIEIVKNYNWMERMERKHGVLKDAEQPGKVFIFTAKKDADDETNLMPPPPPPRPLQPCFTLGQEFTEPAAKRHQLSKAAEKELMNLNKLAAFKQPVNKNATDKASTHDDLEVMNDKMKNLFISDDEDANDNANKATASSCDAGDRLFVKISEDLDSAANTLWNSQSNTDEPLHNSTFASTSGAIPNNIGDHEKKRHHYRPSECQTLEEFEAEQELDPAEQAEAMEAFNRIHRHLHFDDDDCDEDNIIATALSHMHFNPSASIRRPVPAQDSDPKDPEKIAAKALKKQRQKKRREEERQSREALVNAQKEKARLMEEAKLEQQENERLEFEKLELEKREEQRKQSKAKEATKRAEQQRELKKRQEQSRNDKAKKTVKKAAPQIAINPKKGKSESAAAASKDFAKPSNKNTKPSLHVQLEAQPAHLTSIDDDSSSYEPWSSDEFENSDDVKRSLQEDKTDSDYDQPTVIEQQQEVMEELPAMIRIKRVGGAAPSAPTVTISLKGDTPEQDKLLYTLVNGQAELAEPPPQLTAVTTALLPMPDLSVLDDPSLTKKQRKKKTQKLAKQAAKATAANAVLQPEATLAQQPSDQPDLSRELKITLAVDQNLRKVRAGGEPTNNASIKLTQPEESQSFNSEVDASSLVRLPSNFTLPPGITITKVKQQSAGGKPSTSENIDTHYPGKIFVPSNSNSYSATITPISSATYVHRNSASHSKQAYSNPNSYHGGSSNYYHQQNTYQSDVQSQQQSPNKQPYVPFYVTQPKSGSLIVVDTENLIKQGAVKKRKNKKKVSGGQTDVTSNVPQVGTEKSKKSRRSQRPVQKGSVAQCNEDIAVVIESTPSQRNTTEGGSKSADSSKMITLKNPLFNQLPTQPHVQQRVDAQRSLEQLQQDQLSSQLSEQATISKGENGMVTIRRPGLTAADNTGATMSMQDFLREQQPAPTTNWNTYSLFSNPTTAQPTSTITIAETEGLSILDISDPIENLLDGEESDDKLKIDTNLGKSLYQANDIRSSTDHPWKELLSNLPPEVEVTTLPIGYNGRGTFQAAINSRPHRVENARPNSGPSNLATFSLFRTNNSPPPSNYFEASNYDPQFDSASQIPALALERSALNVPDVTLYNSSGLGMPLNDIVPQFGTDTGAIERALAMINVGIPPPTVPPGRMPNPLPMTPVQYGPSSQQPFNMANYNPNNNPEPVIRNQQPQQQQQQQHNHNNYQRQPRQQQLHHYQQDKSQQQQRNHQQQRHPQQQRNHQQQNENPDVSTWGFENVFAPKEILDGELDPIERDVEAFKLFCQQSIPPERKEKVAHLNVKDIVIKKRNKK